MYTRIHKGVIPAQGILPASRCYCWTDARPVQQKPWVNNGGRGEGCGGRVKKGMIETYNSSGLPKSQARGLTMKGKSFMPFMCCTVVIAFS